MAIGETVLSAVLQVVFDRLASKEVVDLFRSSKLDQSLVNKLEDLMQVAEKLLDDAEQKQNSDAKVKKWLDDLKHLFYRAEEIADQIETEAKSPEPKSFRSKVWNLIPASSGSSSFASIVNSQMSEVVTQLEHKVRLSRDLNLREGSVVVNTPSSRETTSYLKQDDKVVGRDLEKQKLLKFLFSEEAEKNRIGVVAIVGMGGMGKSTLAKLVYNDESLEAFDLKAWVYVSDQFDISRVIKSILQSITAQLYSGSLELEFLHHELIGKLRDKRFFLVLDDVWNENYEDWESLLAPLSVGAHGSKIIVTTRNEKVASIMRTVPVIRLKPLSDADGWSLFSKHAFEVGNLSSNPHIEPLGRRIVDKCHGLPLAIKTLGGLLRSQENIHEWKAVLESSLWDDRKGNVAPALRLSYYHLPSHLKRCFSYCAIFPKGYKFDRKTLVLLWMAENLVKPSDKGRRIEDVGEDYFNRLLSCSFFDRSKGCFVMHDLMHDLAEAVSREFFARLEHGDKAWKIPEKARYFSYLQGRFDRFSWFEGLHEAKYLRTFVRLGNLQLGAQNLINEIPVAMIPQYYCLHVLSLSDYKALKLPESIGNLKQLRYLDVSGTKIKELPESVSTLCNLQSLLLSGCSCLERLPAHMSRLESLRHLDIRWTASLGQMPNDMSKLNCLQTLSDFVVGKHFGQGVEELRDLWHIRGKLSLRQLQNASPNGALEAHLSRMEYINELAFQFDDSDNEDSKKGRVVLENLKPHPNLERLTIENYPGTRFPCWLDTQCSTYENMVNLNLSGCKYCCSLPPLGQLPSLQVLEIGGMDHITAIGSELYGYDSALMNPFRVLHTLVICDMKIWTEWSGHEMQERVPFPCLEELSLENCPELKGNLPANLRSLKRLEIRRCESLESPLLQQPSVHCAQMSASHDRALGRSFHLASLTWLVLDGLKELVSLPPEVGTLSCLDDLCLNKLRFLDIWGCENLKSLKNVRLPTNLGRLAIGSCKILESLPEEMDLLDKLQIFELCWCPCVESGVKDTLPTSLQYIHVKSCERWELPIPVERMQCYSALKWLLIHDSSGHLESLPIAAFPNLQNLELSGFRELERVYIPSGVDLMNLTSLRSLSIYECRKLKWIGKTEEEGVVDLPAPNLQHLQITDCDILKPLLSGGREGLPSKLQSLCIDIDYLNNTVTTSSHSNSRNLLMFSSLRELQLHRLRGEYFPDKGSLPVSIIELVLGDCPNLKNLNGEALKALTSLQELRIVRCPNLECLPEEGLPPSLGRLDIWECPKLKGKVQEDCLAQHPPPSMGPDQL